MEKKSYTKSYLENDKEMCIFQHKKKKKCYLCFNEKLEITSYKGENLLNKRSEPINKCRHQNKLILLYDIIARTKSYIFTEIFLAGFPLRLTFQPARIMLLHDLLFETKIEQLRTTVSLENIPGTISCEHGAQMLPLFYPLIWILIHCNCFVILYFLLAQDDRKA